MLSITALLLLLVSGMVMAGKTITVNYERVLRSVKQVELVTSKEKVSCGVWRLLRAEMEERGLSFHEAPIIKTGVAELEVVDGLIILGVILHFSDEEKPESRTFVSRKFEITRSEGKENWMLWNPA